MKFRQRLVNRPATSRSKLGAMTFRSLFSGAIKGLFALVLILCGLGLVIVAGWFVFLPMRAIAISLVARGWNPLLAAVLWLPIPATVWILWVRWRDAHPVTAFDRWLVHAIRWIAKR